MLSGVLRHRIRYWLRLCLVVSATGLWPPPVEAADTSRLHAGDLIITVSGVESDRGAVRYGLYNSAKNFPKRKGRVAKGKVPASRSGSTIVIKGLAPGYYAVAVFHDENQNSVFDQGALGIPLETYGFSNNARGFFSAPDFEDAKFQVRGPKTEISIDLSN